MITGDKQNAILRLKSEFENVKGFKWSAEVQQGVAVGDTKCYLNMFRFIVFNSSRHLTKMCTMQYGIVDAGSDISFLEKVFTMMREEFDMKNVLSPEHFLTTGFVEQKAHLLKAFLKNCKFYHNKIKMAKKDALGDSQNSATMNTTTHLSQINRSQELNATTKVAITAPSEVSPSVASIARSLTDLQQSMDEAHKKIAGRMEAMESRIAALEEKSNSNSEALRRLEKRGGPRRDEAQPRDAEGFVPIERTRSTGTSVSSAGQSSVSMSSVGGSGYDRLSEKISHLREIHKEVKDCISGV